MSGVWAVLVAAGRGERLGGDLPKAFAPLGGRPLLAESLDRLEGSPRVDAIVVVVPPQWEEPAILLAEEIGAGKVTSLRHRADRPAPARSGSASQRWIRTRRSSSCTMQPGLYSPRR